MNTHAPSHERNRLFVGVWRQPVNWVTVATLRQPITSMSISEAPTVFPTPFSSHRASTPHAPFLTMGSGCWGQNNQGQIGDGSTSVRSSAHPSFITIGPQTSTLTFTSGVGKSYIPYVDGMNYTVQVSPSLPSGFTLDTSTGGLTFDGQMPPGTINTQPHLRCRF